MTVHSVVELRGAWRAVCAGEFTAGSRRHSATAEASAKGWVPSTGERVVAVVGCAGGVGASTVAIALATATGVPARVLECCPPLWSGFSAAANAELGVAGAWRRGSRGPVLLERFAGPDPVAPTPVPSSVEWTIVDVGWTVLAEQGSSWLATLLRDLDEVVLVTNATVPGLRRLEPCADLVGRDVLGVVVGPARQRWPRPVRVAAAVMTLPKRLVDFPVNRRLRVTGLTPDPLPASLLRAAHTVLALLRKEPS